MASRSCTALIRTLALIAAIAVTVPYRAIAKCPQPVQHPPVFLPYTPAPPAAPFIPASPPPVTTAPPPPPVDATLVADAAALAAARAKAAAAASSAANAATFAAALTAALIAAPTCSAMAAVLTSAAASVQTSGIAPGFAAGLATDAAALAAACNPPPPSCGGPVPPPPTLSNPATPACDTTGNTDVTACLQAAVNNCGGGVVIPAGTYLVNGNINVPSNCTIECQPGAVLKTTNGAPGTTSPSQSAILKLTGVSGVTIQGCTFTSTNSGPVEYIDWSMEWNFFIQISNSSNNIIQGNTFKDSYANSEVRIDQTEHTMTCLSSNNQILHNDFQNCLVGGTSIIGGCNNTVAYNTAENCGFDLKPNYYDSIVQNNALAYNVVTLTNPQWNTNPQNNPSGNDGLTSSWGGNAATCDSQNLCQTNPSTGNIYNANGSKMTLFCYCSAPLNGLGKGTCLNQVSDILENGPYCSCGSGACGQSATTSTTNNPCPGSPSAAGPPPLPAGP
jgi:hypothetical protein